MATSSALSTSNTYVKYTISVDQNSQSIANNTSNVTIKVRFYRTNTGYSTYGTGTVYCKINGTTYSASVVSSQAITANGIVLFTKTLDIPHNSDGAKTLTCSAWISHNAPLTSSEQSYSQKLTTIPRKSTMSTSNGTLGTEQILTVTRKSASFTHTIMYACGDAIGEICTKSSDTSISWTPPLSLASQNTKGTQVSVSLTITTYNDDTSIGSETYTITCNIPESVKPAVSLNVSDPTGYLSTYGGYVQGQSKFGITITAAGDYGSTVELYKTTVDDSTYTMSLFTTDVIKNSGNLVITTTVTDSRGRTTTVSVVVKVLEYNTPQISTFSIARCTSGGELSSSGAYLKVTFDAAVSALSLKNKATYTIKYKKGSVSTYTSTVLSSYANKYEVANGSYVFAADTASSYDVILEVADAFTSMSRSGNGTPIKKLFSVLKRGIGFAFGKVAELADCLEVAFKARFYKDIQVDGVAILDGDLVFNGTKTSGAINGLHEVDAIVAGADLNDYTTPGVYAITSSAIAETIQNTPQELSACAGRVVTYSAFGQSSIDHIMQEYIAPDKPTFRRYISTDANGTVFGDWEPLAGDYIVEQGTSGIWTYRKWYSGAAECWGTTEQATASISVAWGSIYVRDKAIASYEFPFEFEEAPLLQVSPRVISGNFWIYTNTLTTAVETGAFGVARGNSNTSVPVSANFYAKGVWKKAEESDGIPAYVKEGTLELVSKIRGAQTDNTITFIAMSDAHQDDTNTNIVNGNTHAGMAAKLLTKYVSVDFGAYLGDYTWGSSANTADEIKNHITEVNSYIDGAFANIPQFRTPGNHDGGAYSGANIGSDYLYDVIGKYNSGATYGSTTEGYCYRDFSAKRLRVICLNTAEGGVKESISNTQLLWFANILKDTPTGYGIIIFSHHPLDWGNVLQASNVVYQYTQKGSVSYDGTTVSFASAGATILGAIHGHTHCFKAAKLNYIANSVGTEYDVYRIATPNMCYSRNNEYGTNGSTEYYGIEFGETTTYPKTADSANDTAFVVNVINPDTQMIHSFCYGAGYDREVYIGEEDVAVTGITLNTTSGTLAKEASITLIATVEPSNATNKKVQWSSSNTSIATVSEGVVTAVGVGTATITAQTEDGGFKATYSLTVNAVSQNVLEMVGYTDGVRLSTGSGAEKTAAGYFTTGAFCIDKTKYPNGFTLKVSGVTNAKGGSYSSSNAYRDCAWVAYTDAGTTLSAASYIGDSTPAVGGVTTTMTIDEDDHGFTWTVPSGISAPKYLRFCCYGSGTDAKITITEN